MERCGFFDAELVGDEYDRSYLAEQFAAYFASFIGNGVFGGKSNELQIVAMESPSMQIAALSGQGWINGYWYENTDDLYLPIDVADGVLDRIDSIVLRLGFAERNMWIDVRRGVSSNDPSAPELIRNADYYELQLATVYVKAGALNIRQADITDTRLNSNVCGFVVALLTDFDTSAFDAQLNSWIEIFKQDSMDKAAALITQLEALINTNDLGPLITDIQHLKDLSIESEEYPGCYYRVVNGEVEWLNPPTEPGVEFRTTERFEGKPVYKILVHVLSLPNSSLMMVTPDMMLTKVVSIDGVLFDSATSYTEVYPFPVFMSSSVAPDAMIINVMPGLAWTNIAILTTRDMTAYKADIVVKYVK